MAPKPLLRRLAQINLLFSHWKSLIVALPQSQFSLTRLSAPPCTHVPPNCLAPSPLHALPFSLYTVIVTLNTIAIDCFISSFLRLSESSAQAGGNIDFGEISATSPGRGRIGWTEKAREPQVKSKSRFYQFSFYSVLSDMFAFTSMTHTHYDMKVWTAIPLPTNQEHNTHKSSLRKSYSV